MDISMILSFVVLIGVFYLFLIRPESKKKKAAQQLRSSLVVGDRIVTIGGIVGIICSLKEESIVIETSADRVRMELMRWAISNKLTEAPKDAAPAANPSELEVHDEKEE